MAIVVGARNLVPMDKTNPEPAGFLDRGNHHPDASIAGLRVLLRHWRDGQRPPEEVVHLLYETGMETGQT